MPRRKAYPDRTLAIIPWRVELGPDGAGERYLLCVDTIDQADAAVQIANCAAFHGLPVAAARPCATVAEALAPAAGLRPITEHPFWQEADVAPQGPSKKRD
jgi:hypothetical protein